MLGFIHCLIHVKESISMFSYNHEAVQLKNYGRLKDAYMNFFVIARNISSQLCVSVKDNFDFLCKNVIFS